MYLTFPIAILIDGIIGDPPIIWRNIKHPVTWMANMLMFGEGYLNNNKHSAFASRILGLILILICSIVCFSISLFIQKYVTTFDQTGLILAILTSIFLAFRSLMDHVEHVKIEMEKKDIEKSRNALSKIVGRETKNLDPEAISRASVETLAENFSDGFMAPVFWFLVAGFPGIVTYKMINTADSMIGNKSERFVHFGWASARLDDVANYIPARLTVLFLCFSAGFINKTKPVSGLKISMRDHGLHASPNAGWPEAAMAGLLDVRLGGPRSYSNGSVKDNQWLGNNNDIKLSDLDTALKVVKLSWLIVLLTIIGGISYVTI